MDSASEAAGIRVVIALATIVTLGTACATQATFARRPPAANPAVASPRPTAESPAAPVADPTVGRLINVTRWRVEVFIDAPPDSLGTAPSKTLNPRETRPADLDLGPHRVIALAFVDTQFGSRMVGRYDRTIQVNPRGSGWSLRFTEGLFR